MASDRCRPCGSHRDPEEFFLELLRRVDEKKFAQRKDVAQQLAKKFVTAQRFIDYVTSGGPFVKFENKKVNWTVYELDNDDLARLRDLVFQILEERSLASSPKSCSPKRGGICVLL